MDGQRRPIIDSIIRDKKKMLGKPFKFLFIQEPDDVTAAMRIFAMAQ